MSTSSGRPRPLRHACAPGLLIAVAFLCARAQAPAGQSAEVASHDAPLVFKTKVNLVTIPVVVRDSKGRATGNLTRDDFQVFDNGKPQIVSRFSVEKFGEQTPAAPVPAQAQAATPAAAPAMPERFVAYLFDDLNTKFTDLAQAREAAFRHMASSLQPFERAAVYTTSGSVTLDFTGDRDRLRQSLLSIRPQSSLVSAVDCPPMSIYKADQIQNRSDTMALGATMAEVKACTGGNLSDDEAEFRARNAARTTLALADRNVRFVLAALDGVIGKLSHMAGQRTMVLVSSGFVMLDDRRQDEIAALERAVRANIVVNSLDARALWALNSGQEAAAHTINAAITSVPSSGAPLSGGGSSGGGGSSLIVEGRLESDAALADRDFMAEVSGATGGRFFENSNDLDGGFARLATAPEYVYVLAFAPEALKLDGKYHNLKIAVRNAKGMAIEARRGYYAPRYGPDPADRARQEVEEAFFSREETHDIPVLVQTQFFKTADGQATLSVAAKVDIHNVTFRKEDGRNRDDLTVVSGVFDRDGNFITGKQKIVEMRLRDETFDSRLAAGVTVRSTFSVPPGAYMVRIVVRDAGGESLASQSGAVEIP